jgi:hypothetical protein
VLECCWTMINESEIEVRLACYVASLIPFRQFQDWLIAVSFNMHKESSLVAQNLIHDIDLDIYEYLDGYLNENELKAKLSRFVGHYSLPIGGSARPSPSVRSVPSSSPLSFALSFEHN